MPDLDSAVLDPLYEHAPLAALGAFAAAMGFFASSKARVAREARLQAWWAGLNPAERGLRWAVARACAWSMRRLEWLHNWCVTPEGR